MSLCCDVAATQRCSVALPDCCIALLQHRSAASPFCRIALPHRSAASPFCRVALPHRYFAAQLLYHCAACHAAQSRSATARHPAPYTGGMLSSHRAAKQSVGVAATSAAHHASRFAKPFTALCMAVCMVAPASWSAVPARAEDSTSQSATTLSCASSVALAKSWYDVSDWAPSPTQRLLMAIGARQAWSRAAALCPASVFPEATVRAAVSQYRATKLATAQGRQSWLTGTDFFNDSTTLLAAVRTACGKDSTALDLSTGGTSASDDSSNGSGNTDTGSNGTDDNDTGTTVSSCISQSSTQPSQIIGATSDELNAISTAYDRAAFVMTFRNAQNSNADDLASATAYKQSSANYAAMVTLGCGRSTRSGVYSTQAVRAMADPVVDPATGYTMPVATSTSLDVVINALSTISAAGTADDSGASGASGASSNSSASADGGSSSSSASGFASTNTAGSSESSGVSGSAASTASSTASGSSSSSGSLTSGLDYTTQTIEVSGVAYEPAADGSTDPAAGLDSPAARRRAMSEELSARLLACFNAGVPAREDVILG